MPHLIQDWYEADDSWWPQGTRSFLFYILCYDTGRKEVSA